MQDIALFTFRSEHFCRMSSTTGLWNIYKRDQNENKTVSYQYSPCGERQKNTFSALLFERRRSFEYFPSCYTLWNHIQTLCFEFSCSVILLLKERFYAVVCNHDILLQKFMELYFVQLMFRSPFEKQVDTWWKIFHSNQVFKEQLWKVFECNPPNKVVLRHHLYSDLVVSFDTLKLSSSYEATIVVRKQLNDVLREKR